ncbi:hypothetical protein Q4Q34_06505 [Flavivirga abyssicola]|uniref:hypothetical protein n=1 Tax=Flavivirga abyssicola TaxID=3063533 RepID=UPI0026DF714E|nr:hypothetical protein [Flavivirga sp. MEBiC07777]WVK14678.1 hypothetical protein Q4Q34_06505 [Flavivirga sp. MEBiC07777]
MKLYLKTALVFTYLILSVIVACSSNDDNTSTYESELAQLSLLKADIETLANTSVCNENFECKFIALGSKPCGGPWSYLIYTTSIDVEQLKAAVKDYNQKESDFNVKWGIPSDCALTIQPTGVTCENNTCVLVY